jgi:hypothetical protein
MTIFFLLMIAHVLADFYFQSERMIERKQTRIGTLLWHSAIYFAFTLLCTIGFLTVPMALWLLGLSAFHFVVDWVFRKKNFARLLIDQALHVAAIAFVTHMISFYSGGFLVGVWAWAMAPRRLAILFFLLLNIKPANIFIVKLMEQCGLDSGPAGKVTAGAVIGSLERLLTLILILCGEYLAGTLVVALKSIGRIKKLDEPDFSDKFIIGSLLSLMFPVLSAIIINLLP